jgi:hypothetical protein
VPRSTPNGTWSTFHVNVHVSLDHKVRRSVPREPIVFVRQRAPSGLEKGAAHESVPFTGTGAASIGSRECRFAEGWDPAVAEAFPLDPHRRDVIYLPFFSGFCPGFCPGLSRARYDSPARTDTAQDRPPDL